MIGPLQETSNGNKYIVAVTDHFSKWTEATAVPDKSAKSVAQFMYSVTCRLGCMDTLISDQGREFVNAVIDNLMEHFQTDHRISSAYHPQTNGQRERDNRTLKESLCKLVNEQGNNWDQFIPGVLFAYHTSVHASTKCTPFEVMYGRKAKLPLDLKSSEESAVGPKLLSDEASSAVLQTMTTIRDKLYSTVSSNISSAQQRQKQNFDRRHNSSRDLTIGATVYIKNQRRIHRMGSKMEPRWIGPYTVVESLTKGRVKLRNNQTQKILKNTYNASNLKMFQDADSSPQPLSPEGFQSTSADEFPKQTALIRPFQEPENEDMSMSMTQKQPTRTFNPLPPLARKNLCAALGLTFNKIVYYGRTKDLGQPRRFYKTKGDGNCYFRAICYILTGSEKDHSLLREKVIHHMRTSLSTELRNYLNHNVNNYLDTSCMSQDSVWATDAEIMATANLLSCDIVVHTKVGDSMDWLTYTASFHLHATSETALYLENKLDHFDVVLSV